MTPWNRTFPDLVEFYLKNRWGRPEMVRVEVVGQRLRIKSPYSDDVRALDGATWDKAERVTFAKNSYRNRLQIELLSGILPVEYAPYLQKTEPAGSVRTDLKPLWLHQQRLLGKTLACRRVVLAAEMATGKSRVAIECFERYPDREWLYIAPDKAQASFRLQLREWRCRVKPRFITPESLYRLVLDWPKGQPVPFGIVADECSRFKNPEANRTIALQHLADANRREHADGFVLLLSGTPAPQDHNDWWSLCEIACPGWLRESSRWKFDRRLSIYETVTIAERSFPRRLSWVREEVELLQQKRLPGVVYALKQEDTELNLPAPVVERIVLPVSEELARTAWLIASTCPTSQRSQRLRQLSDGFQYQDDGSEKRVECPKDDALGSLLDEHEESGRAIVYAGYAASVDRCVEVARARGWEVLKCDGRGWQYLGRRYLNADAALGAMSHAGDPEDRLCFVGHPGAGGFGLNMQGSLFICFYSNSDSAEHRAQGCARNRRKGMDERRGGRIYDLIHLGTDKIVLDRVLAKQDALNITLDEVREALGVVVR